jgi:transposase
MQIVRGVKGKVCQKLQKSKVQTLMISHENRLQFYLHRTELCVVFATIESRHDSFEAAPHFSVLQFDCKKNLRIRVQNENTEQVWPREKIFRNLSSNMERNSIVKKNMGLHTPSAKFAFHFFVL